MMKIRVQGNEAIIDGDEGFASSLIKGCKGKLKVKSPFGKREVNLVDKFKNKPEAKKKKVKA